LAAKLSVAPWNPHCFAQDKRTVIQFSGCNSA
jgi:hypothetical protein